MHNLKDLWKRIIFAWNTFIAEQMLSARKYKRLLNAVGIKYPHESRHDTILRYIREREERELEKRELKTVNKNGHSDWKQNWK